jgi:peptide deformylase
VNEKMEEYTIEGTELLARAFCHEIDHLDGILYVDKTVGELRNTITIEEVQ